MFTPARAEALADHVQRRPSPSAEQLLDGARRVVVLEGMNDHENLGSIFRNSAALGLDAVVLDDPVALVLGAEGPGLSEATMAACDARVRIPMGAGVDPLNVATSLAVVASFAAARRGWAD